MASGRHQLLPSLAAFAWPAILISTGLFVIPMAFVATYTAGESRSFLAGVREVAGSNLVFRVFMNTLEISVTAAIVSVCLAYPVALHVMRQSRIWKAICLTLILVPFWTSILVKSYAFIGMTNFLVPFAIFPILASLSAQNQAIQSAADVMGASPLRVFWSITFPQSLPGVFAALLICLVISMGFFVTPALLGGRQDMMMANVIDLYTREILDWQSASLIALLLLVFCSVVSAAILKLQTSAGR